MKNSKRGFVLIASLLLILFLGIYIGFSFMRADVSHDYTEITSDSSLAFYAAEAGAEQAKMQLRQNPAWAGPLVNVPVQWNDGVNPPTTIATYSVNVLPGPVFITGVPTVWVQSIGKCARISSRNVNAVREVRVRVMVDNPARFFASTLHDLTIVSGANINGDVLARDVNFVVYAGVPINLNNKLFYTRNLNGFPAGGVNIAGGTFKLPPVEFTGVNLTNYKNLAQAGGRYEAGNFTYSNNIDAANLAAGNQVVFVEGDLHISGNLLGSMLFVAKGTIYIDGNINAAGLDQIGLFAGQNVIISAAAGANVNIQNSMIIADGGRLQAQGVPGSRGTLNFNGSMAARGYEGEPTAMDLNAFGIRNLAYNVDLFNAGAIPFMPSFIAVLCWREAQTGEPWNAAAQLVQATCI